MDPRIELENMIWEMREKLNQIEMKLWEIPHAVETYEAPFVAPVEGDYMHPETPTHPCPVELGEEAYYDTACQGWMQPSEDEADEYNVYANMNTDMNFDTEANVWIEDATNDWSNEFNANTYFYADDIAMEYTEAPMTDDANVSMPEPEVHYDTDRLNQEHYETAPEGNAMPTDGTTES
jgi:hypothetical protein